MSYSNPDTVTYFAPVVQDFGAGVGAAWSFKGPTGKKGTIFDVGVRVTEDFSDDTAPTAAVQVGSSSTAAAYAKLQIADGTANTDTFNIQDDPDCLIADPNTDNPALSGAGALPADTQVEVSYIASSDSGTTAGIGYPYVSVEWY